MSMPLTPSTGDSYYLIVPNNGFREGSYGRDGGNQPGSMRHPAWTRPVRIERRGGREPDDMDFRQTIGGSQALPRLTVMVTQYRQYSVFISVKRRQTFSGNPENHAYGQAGRIHWSHSFPRQTLAPRTRFSQTQCSIIPAREEAHVRFGTTHPVRQDLG